MRWAGTLMPGAAGVALVVALGIPAARAMPIDLSTFYADPSVTVAVDGSSALLAEDLNFNPVFLSSFDFMNSQVVPAALFSVAAGDTFGFDFDFVEPAGSDDEFFFNILDDAGSVLSAVFFTDTDSTGRVTVTLGAFAGLTIGFEFGLDAFDLALDSTVNISNVELVRAVVPVPEPSSVLLMIIGIAGLLRVRAPSPSRAPP